MKLGPFAVKIYAVDDCSVWVYFVPRSGCEILKMLELLCRRRDWINAESTPQFSLLKGFEVEVGNNAKIVVSTFQSSEKSGTIISVCIDNFSRAKDNLHSCQYI